MAQMTLELGVDTYTLPYSQSYKETNIIRAAEFTSYTGVVHRDFRDNTNRFPRIVFIGWEELSTAEMIDLNTTWQALAQNLAAVWTFTDPNGDTWDAYLNPENFNLQTTRFAGPDGTVLYTARMSLFIE